MENGELQEGHKGKAVGSGQRVKNVMGGHLGFRKKVTILWSFQSLKTKALWWLKGEGALSQPLSVQ